MKNLYLAKIMIALLVLPLVFSNCSSDEPVTPPILLPKLDGLYIYGSNTIADSPTSKEAKMAQAVLDPGQGAMVSGLDGVYGKFLYIGANSTIEFALIEGEVGTTYGAVGGGSLDSAINVGGAIMDKVINGTLVANEAPIAVTQEGLYYAYINTNDMSFILSKVKANIIGDATELNWSAGTPLPVKSLSKDSAVFEGTNIVLYGATGYRYRFNDGWHFYQGPNIVTLSSLGVESYGDAWDTGINDIGFFLDNIPHKEGGLFTVKLKYTAATGEWKETKTKTGEVLKDHSDEEFGWFGNAYFVDGDTEGAWDAIHHAVLPTKADNLYTWSWTMTLIQDRSFVLRENADPGAWITYGGAGKVGSAFDNGDIIKEEGQDNYFVAVGGDYDVTFTINAEDEGRTLTIEPSN